jgi:hypothetical protein
MSREAKIVLASSAPIRERKDGLRWGTNRRMAQGRKRDDLLSGYPLGIARRLFFEVPVW